MKMGNWEPSLGSIRILDRAYEHVNSVSYKVSLRWLFYRLLQDGIYKAKGNYNNLKGLVSKARKNFFGKWRPDSLSDQTRHSIIPHRNF